MSPCWPCCDGSRYVAAVRPPKVAVARSSGIYVDCEAQAWAPATPARTTISLDKRGMSRCLLTLSSRCNARSSWRHFVARQLLLAKEIHDGRGSQRPCSDDQGRIV